MPMYNFSCNKCGKDFIKILSSSDCSSVICSQCGSNDIKKTQDSTASHNKNNSASIPSGALSGGSCKSGFS